MRVSKQLWLLIQAKLLYSSCRIHSKYDTQQKPAFVFIQYLSILGCTDPKEEIRFLDFFGQRSKIITFEPDIDFKIFEILKKKSESAWNLLEAGVFL